MTNEIKFTADSSTTWDRNIAVLTAKWQNPTDATRQGALLFQLADASVPGGLREVGRIFVQDGKCYFTGDVDESAKVLFEAVVWLLNKQLEEQKEQHDTNARADNP